MRRRGALVMAAALVLAAPAAAGIFMKQLPAKSGWTPLAPEAGLVGSVRHVRPGETFLTQPLVPLAAARPDVDIAYRGMDIAAGTELFGAELVEDGRKLYCHDRTHPNGNVLGRNYYCLDDENGDGRFDGRFGTFLTSFGGPKTSIPAIEMVYRGREPIPPVPYTLIRYDAANATRAIGLRLDSLDLKKRRATFVVVVGRKGELAPAPQRFRLALAELPARTDILGAEIEVVAVGGDGVDLRVVKPLPPELFAMRAR
jgi:hypothetical protein